MGVDTIAWPLAGLIRDFDAPHAFYVFAQQLGLSADILVFDEGIEGAEQRVQFREANELLLEAECLCTGTRLSPEPIATSLRDGTTQAYVLLQVLEEASAVDRQLQLLAGHPWRSAHAYEAKAAEALADWAHRTTSTFADIAEAIYVFSELERTARDAVATISRLEEHARKAAIDAATTVAVSAIVARVADIDRLLALEESSPHDLVNELLTLQEELEILLKAEHTRHAQRGATMVQLAFQVLQLTETATWEEVTAVYRKLAKQFHPDHNFNGEEAIDRMQEINAARDILRQHFSQAAAR